MDDEYPRGRRRRWIAFGLVLALAGAAVGAIAYNKALPAATATQSMARTYSATSDVLLPWPQQGEAALAVDGVNTIQGMPGEKPVPIASIAKVMTAYVVLEARPLAPGQQGPSITVDNTAINDYNSRLANGESTLPVMPGEKLTEYQALQGMLLPSGNNAAALLARWVAGSEAAFAQHMNETAKKLGMTKSLFQDSSGVSPQTVSTPTDLVRLAKAAMANPVLAGIVAQPEATVPVAGSISNIDSELGTDGVIGIKTGSFPNPAVANFLFAGRELAPWGDSVTVYGAVLGQSTLASAFAATEALVTAAPTALSHPHLASKGQVVGHYETAWGSSVPVIAATDLYADVWRNGHVQVTLQARPLKAPMHAGLVVGRLAAGEGQDVTTVPVRLAGALDGPNFAWRLFRKP
ncbi:MAG: D-alanyl-D-alanine carboxypeptidase [Candidatus Dormibacteraeota bacterium]|nr:D-alanyl-D-alanine carboxypeptidase [Candidatus Dormibacteraeota bacterium]